MLQFNYFIEPVSVVICFTHRYCFSFTYSILLVLCYKHAYIIYTLLLMIIYAFSFYFITIKHCTLRVNKIFSKVAKRLLYKLLLL